MQEMATIEVLRNRRLNMRHRTGVYAIINTATGCMYIGSAKRNFQHRFVTHRNALNKGNHHSPRLQASWNSRGERAFEFAVIEDCPPENCISREQLWMNFFNPEYNVVKKAGSTSGYRHSDEIKAKMRERMKGFRHTEDSKRKIGDANRGHAVSQEGRLKIGIASRSRICTEQARANMSASRKGRKHSEETKLKIAEANRRRIWSSESKKKLSESHKKNSSKRSSPCS